MTERSDPGGRAAAMRLAFDGAFARAAHDDVTPMEDLLAFRLGSEPYALRMAEISGLFIDRKITPVPGPVSLLLGLAGFRGSIVPVYDLHALLGRQASATARWLAVAAAAPVAVAIEAFEGYLRVPRATIAPRQVSGKASLLIREVASAEGGLWPIVHLPSVTEAIRERLPTARPREMSDVQ